MIPVNKNLMERMKEKISRIPASHAPSRTTRLIVTLVIGAILIAITVLCFPQRFESHEDLAMMQIASGLFTEKPDAHLVFQNVVVGLFLRALYASAPDGPWYALFLIGVQFLSVSALLFALFSRRFSLANVVFFTVFFALLLVPILIQLSFVSTAFLAAAAGIFLLLSAQTGDTPRRRIFFRFAGVLIFVLAGLIRSEAALLAGILALPLILFVPKTDRIFVGSAVTAAALLILLFIRFDVASYSRDAGWSAFLERSRDRNLLQDYPALTMTGATGPHFNKVGWDENDVRVFQRSFRFDERVYSTENLRYLAQNLPRPASRSRNLQDGWNVLWANKLAAALVAGVIALTLLLLNRKRRWMLLSVAVLCAGLFAYLGLAAKLPLGIAHSLILFSAWAAVWFIGSVETTARLRDLWRWAVSSLPATAVTIVVVILAALQAYSVVNQARENEAYNRHFERFVTGIIDRGPESIYVSYANSVPFEDMSPFFRMRRLRECNFIPGGWLTGSPVYHAALKRLQIDDVNQAMLTQPNCYLIVNEKLYDDAENSLTKFYRRHYREKVLLPPLARVGDTRVCRILLSR